MATIKFLIKKSKVNKHGESPLYLAFYNDDNTELVSTGVCIKAAHWDADNQRTRTGKKYPEDLKDIDVILEGLKKDAVRIERDLRIDSGIAPTAYQIKAEWGKRHDTKKAGQRENDASEKKDSPISVKVDKWLANLTHKPLTIKAVTNSMKKFKAFIGNINVSQLTKDHCDAYAAALYNEKRWRLSRSSHGRHIKHLRWFLKSLTPRPFDFRDLKIDNSRKKIIALSWDELQAIQALQVTDKAKQKAKDLFLLACYTCLRISDLRRLSKNFIHIDIRTGAREIRLTTLKNKKDVEIPILAPAWEILTRYDLKAPKISEQKANKLIKEVCQDAGLNRKVDTILTKGNKDQDQHRQLHQTISLHVGSKTFISLAEERWKLTASQLAAIVGKDTRTIDRHYKALNSATGKAKIHEIEQAEQAAASVG